VEGGPGPLSPAALAKALAVCCVFGKQAANGLGVAVGEKTSVRERAASSSWGGYLHTFLGRQGRPLSWGAVTWGNADWTVNTFPLDWVADPAKRSEAFVAGRAQQALLVGGRGGRPAGLMMGQRHRAWRAAMASRQASSTGGTRYEHPGQGGRSIPREGRKSTDPSGKTGLVNRPGPQRAGLSRRMAARLGPGGSRAFRQQEVRGEKAEEIFFEIRRQRTRKENRPPAPIPGGRPFTYPRPSGPCSLCRGDTTQRRGRTCTRGLAPT